MISRRQFLQTNAAGLALPLPRVSPPSHPAVRSVNPLPPDATPSRDYWNDWPSYLTSKVNLARNRRMEVLRNLGTPAQVLERIQMVREKVWELVGGPLEKTPLNPQLTGTIERKLYRIEKVIFESQPQVFVTAHLYIPAAGNPNALPPFPAILAPLGHTSNGKAYRNYQYTYQTLARMGYVVLAFDPFGQGERHQYLDARTGKSRLGPTGEHSQAGRPLLLLGATFAQYRAWDAVRALDYLLSRPEVDPKRIGCTGHSGGGTMTMYLCAMEPRIHVTVEVEGNSENFAGPQYDPPGAVADAEQNLVGGLALGGTDSQLIDRGDLLMAFAPKPLLICFTPQDAGTTYSPNYSQGTKEIYEELKKVYETLGEGNKVNLFASPLPHDLDYFNRQAAYAWFNRWLGKEGLATAEAEFESSPAEALNCTSTGQVLTALGGRSLLQLNIDRARAVVPKRSHPAVAAAPSGAKNSIRESLQKLLALPSERTALEARTLSTVEGQGLTFEEFDFRPEPEMRVPGWFIKPNRKSGPLPTILYVAEDGKDGVVEEPNEISTLAHNGFAVCAIDLRGFGISSPRYPKAGPLFYEGEHAESGYAWAGLTIGKPVLGQRVWDVLRCLDYLDARSDVDHTRVYLLGVKGGAITCLVAAVLDDRPRSIAAYHMLCEFRSVVESEEYSLALSWFVFGILPELDIPDLAASLAPKPCWVINSTGAHGEPLPKLAATARFQIAVDNYSKAGASDRLHLIVQSDGELGSALERWLMQS